jgi:hypothetical protein
MHPWAMAADEQTLTHPCKEPLAAILLAQRKCGSRKLLVIFLNRIES